MKTFLLVLAAASLSGCAVYPAYPVAPAHTGYAAPAYVEPIHFYGGGVYRYGGHPFPYANRYHPRGHHPIHPHGFSGYGARPYLHSPRPGLGGVAPHRFGHPPGHHPGQHPGHPGRR